MNATVRSVALAATLLLLAAPVAAAQGGTGTLAYQVAGQGIYTVATSGGTADLIVPGGSLPAYSPNGNQLAYVKGNALYVANANGAKAKKLAKLPTFRTIQQNGGPPTWSPNGKQIAFANDGIIQVINATGGKPRTIVNLQRPSVDIDIAHHPQWVGSRIYYLATNAASGEAADPIPVLASVTASSGAGFSTTTMTGPAFPGAGSPYFMVAPFTLAYSSAAQAFAVTMRQVTAGPGGPTPTGQFAAGTLPQAGGAVTAIAGFSSPAWSPDGSQLCATGPLGALVVITAQGSFVSEAVAATGNPATGPNGCTWQP